MHAQIIRTSVESGPIALPAVSASARVTPNEPRAWRLGARRRSTAREWVANRAKDVDAIARVRVCRRSIRSRGLSKPFGSRARVRARWVLGP